MPSVVVRRLSPADAVAYRTLMLAAYANHPEAFTSTAEERAAQPMAWWAARLGEDGAQPAQSVSFGAEVDGQLCGAATLVVETNLKSRHKATLVGMYVAPHCRRLGLGRQLIEALLAYARQREGLRQVLLTVSEGNQAAQDLYEGCGFKVFGIEPEAMALGEGFIAKVHMWCRL